MPSSIDEKSIHVQGMKLLKHERFGGSILFFFYEKVCDVLILNAHFLILIAVSLFHRRERDRLSLCFAICSVDDEVQILTIIANKKIGTGTNVRDQSNKKDSMEGYAFTLSDSEQLFSHSLLIYVSLSPM